MSRVLAPYIVRDASRDAHVAVTSDDRAPLDLDTTTEERHSSPLSHVRGPARGESSGHPRSLGRPPSSMPACPTTRPHQSVASRDLEVLKERANFRPIRVDSRYLTAALAWPPGSYRDPPPDGPRSADAMRHFGGYWTPEGRDLLARVLRRVLEHHGRAP
jgi:hypothetical protein